MFQGDSGSCTVKVEGEKLIIEHKERVTNWEGFRMDEAKDLGTSMSFKVTNLGSGKAWVKILVKKADGKTDQITHYQLDNGDKKALPFDKDNADGVPITLEKTSDSQTIRVWYTEKMAKLVVLFDSNPYAFGGTSNDDVAKKPETGKIELSEIKYYTGSKTSSNANVNMEGLWSFTTDKGELGLYFANDSKCYTSWKGEDGKWYYDEQDEWSYTVDGKNVTITAEEKDAKAEVTVTNGVATVTWEDAEAAAEALEFAPESLTKVNATPVQAPVEGGEGEEEVIPEGAFDLGLNIVKCWGDDETSAWSESTKTLTFGAGVNGGTMFGMWSKDLTGYKTITCVIESKTCTWLKLKARVDDSESTEGHVVETDDFTNNKATIDITKLTSQNLNMVGLYGGEGAVVIKALYAEK